MCVDMSGMQFPVCPHCGAVLPMSFDLGEIAECENIGCEKRFIVKEFSDDLSNATATHGMTEYDCFRR